jgi:hypothetical protein
VGLVRNKIQTHSVQYRRGQRGVESPDRARNGDWRVEYFGRDSAGYVTIFTGPDAERRARDYFQALKSGAVDSVG